MGVGSGVGGGKWSFGVMDVWRIGQGLGIGVIKRLLGVGTAWGCLETIVRFWREMGGGLARVVSGCRAGAGYGGAGELGQVSDGCWLAEIARAI